MKSIMRNSPYAKKQPRKLSPAWRYAIIISSTTYSSAYVVSRLGILRLYPHLVIVDILVVGIGFLGGWVGVIVDERRREKPLFDNPFRSLKHAAFRLKGLGPLSFRSETVDEE